MRKNPVYPLCVCLCLCVFCLLVFRVLTQCLAISGYGYYRPNITLFDPGWRGEQTKGPEDSEWGVVDLGNDPTAIVDKYALFQTPYIVSISCLLVHWVCACYLTIASPGSNTGTFIQLAPVWIWHNIMEHAVTVCFGLHPRAWEAHIKACYIYQYASYTKSNTCVCCLCCTP